MPSKNKNNNPFTETPVMKSNNSNYQALMDTMWHSWGIFVNEVQYGNDTNQNMYYICFDTSHLSSGQASIVRKGLQNFIGESYILKRPVVNTWGTISGWKDGAFRSKTEAVEIGLESYYKMIVHDEMRKQIDEYNF